MKKVRLPPSSISACVEYICTCCAPNQFWMITQCNPHSEPNPFLHLFHTQDWMSTFGLHIPLDSHTHNVYIPLYVYTSTIIERNGFINEANALFNRAASEDWPLSVMSTAGKEAGLSDDQSDVCVKLWKTNKLAIHEIMIQQSRWSGSLNVSLYDLSA